MISVLYSSIDNNKIKDLKKLQVKKYRDKKEKFLVEGRHLVLEAYKTGYLDELLLEENELLPLDVMTHYMTNNVSNYLSELDKSTNIIGVCNKKEGSLKGNRIVYLDCIQDPGNLGTIIRSSVAFGADTVVLSNNTVDLYNDKVLRSSEGMIFHIDIVKRDVYELVDLLHDKGYKVYGTKVDGGTDLKNVTVSDKCVIVMGNEGNGVSSKLLDKCDEYIYINMKGTCESLNVGVATSIILYELL